MKSLLVIATALLFFSPSAWAATDQEIDQAISHMQSWLYNQQNAQNGTWMQDREFHLPQAHQRAETAVIVMSLLLSGESVHDQLVPREGSAAKRDWHDLARPERLARAIKYLYDIGYDGFNGTYAVALRMHCWSLLNPNRPSLFKQDAKWLLAAHRSSIFDYGAKPSQRIDHAITLMGILGVWEYAKAGGEVPSSFWSEAADHFVKTQETDGGWTQMPGTGQSSQGDMTAAGLTVLFIAQQQLYRQDDQIPPPLTKAIDRGLAWLDLHFVGLNQPGTNRYQYQWLFNLQQVGLLSGIRSFHGHDWYDVGVRDILGNLRPDGSIKGDLLDTAYALAFLSRGRTPIAISKLKVPEANWNNRPNDIYFLTEFLSKQYERELHWQVVSIDSDSERWLTPIVYLASDQAISLSAKDQRNLKQYLDRGGTLLASADQNNKDFIQSIQTLATNLYPQYELRPIASNVDLTSTYQESLSPEASPIAGLLYRVTPEYAKQVYTLSNGVRDLIVLSTQDWGLAFQGEEPTTTKSSWRMICNLYANTTGQGNWSQKTEANFPERLPYRKKKGDISVVRARVGSEWNAEPLAWPSMVNRFFNRTGFELKIDDQPLKAIGGLNVSLVHLVGINATKLSDSEVQAIRSYVNKGGTLLVEPLGGKSGFLISVEKQLSKVLGTIPIPLSSASPIISGSGLEGGYDNQRVIYRSYAVLNYAVHTQPRLAAMWINDRPTVLFTQHDLSLGMLGARHWNINGYSAESARKMMTNILLSSQR